MKYPKPLYWIHLGPGLDSTPKPQNPKPKALLGQGLHADQSGGLVRGGQVLVQKEDVLEDLGFRVWVSVSYYGYYDCYDYKDRPRHEIATTTILTSIALTLTLCIKRSATLNPVHSAFLYGLRQGLPWVGGPSYRGPKHVSQRGSIHLTVAMSTTIATAISIASAIVPSCYCNGHCYGILRSAAS